MKRLLWSSALFVGLITVILSGCASASTPPPPTSEPTSPPTEAATSPALPGTEVVPLATLRDSIPWLDLDTSARPNVYYFLFNLSKQPFSNVLVRQAFAAATDRDTLAKTAATLGAENVTPATTVTPSQTLGRDLYNEVGIPFNPARARDLLDQAGYADRSQFPPVTLIMGAGKNADFDAKMTGDLVTNWRVLLGVEVTVVVVEEKYFQRLLEGTDDIFTWGWGADYNDPDDFLGLIFSSNAEGNVNHFSSAEFDALVDQAAASTDPAERQRLYIEAERILCETEVALIPIFHSTINVP